MWFIWCEQGCLESVTLIYMCIVQMLILSWWMWFVLEIKERAGLEATVQYLVQAPTSAAMNNDGTVKYDADTQFSVLWQATVTSLSDYWGHLDDAQSFVPYFWKNFRNWTCSSTKYFSGVSNGFWRWSRTLKNKRKKWSGLIAYLPEEVVLLTQCTALREHPNAIKYIHDIMLILKLVLYVKT